jgi:hypothetical protein
VGAVLSKGGGGGATDAGQGASDQDDWATHILILAICSAVTRKVQWKFPQRFGDRRPVSAAAVEAYIGLPGAREKDFIR